jgi:hypothetical protein
MACAGSSLPAGHEFLGVDNARRLHAIVSITDPKNIFGAKWNGLLTGTALTFKQELTPTSRY